MALNVIQLHNEIKSQIDFVNNPRFPSRDYDRAINLSIEEIVNDRYDNIKNVKNYSFDSVQRVKDELRTLVTKTSPTSPTGDVVSFPVSYKHLLHLLVTLDGIDVASRAISFDELTGILNNSYTEPDADNPVFTEDVNGLTVYHGSSSFTSSVLTYLKTPDIVSAGLERQQIVTGSGVIVTSSVYLVVTDGTTHNSVVYESGETFIAANTNLTSGQVVLQSNTTDTDLPDILHQEISKRAAALLEGWVGEFDSKKSLEFDANKS